MKANDRVTHSHGVVLGAPRRWRTRLPWFVTAHVLAACSIEPIPSIQAPVDVVVSSLAGESGLVAVVGGENAAPPGTVVEVTGTGAPVEVAVTADGSFVVSVDARTGEAVVVRTRLGSAFSDAVHVPVRGAGEAGVPRVPGAAGAAVVVTVPDASGVAKVIGAAGSVDPNVDVLVAAESLSDAASLVTRATAGGDGAFAVSVNLGVGRAVNVVAVNQNAASPARVIKVPATPGERDDDGDEVRNDDDCDDDDPGHHDDCAPDGSDAPDGQDGKDGSDDSTDGTDSTDDGTDSTDDGSDAADGTDAEDGTDATDAAEGTDDGGGGDGPEPSDATDAAEGTDAADS